MSLVSISAEPTVRRAEREVLYAQVEIHVPLIAVERSEVGRAGGGGKPRVDRRHHRARFARVVIAAIAD